MYSESVYMGSELVYIVITLYEPEQFFFKIFKLSNHSVHVCITF